MQTTTATDRVHLGRAIELARNGVGRANPNPVVGAVLAVEETVLGEGWHDELGGPHAEVNAIAACGEADLSAVFAVGDTLAQHVRGDALVVIKSTVSV